MVCMDCGKVLGNPDSSEEVKTLCMKCRSVVLIKKRKDMEREERERKENDD